MKAVILAGGEGKRLRPLTTFTPKPMVPLFGKPVLYELLRRLKSAGVDEAVVTLRYLPEQVRHVFGGEFEGMRLQYRVEQQPRGTAGAVRDAAAGFDEPFLIVSGDAVCDFDFEKIMQFHREKESRFTIACRRVREPGEYGLVRVNETGRISGFSEKPGWNRTDTDLANTGVYAADPSVLSLIDENGSVDFAADVFPKILHADLPFFAMEQEGYWCDIGSPESYKDCHWAVLDGKTAIELPKKQKDVYCEGTLPTGSFTIIPPVWFGKGVSVGKDAVIGPYAVVGDGCYIGKGATVRKSVLQQKVFLGENTMISDGILCEGVSVKRECRIFENAVVGARTVIGEGSSVAGSVIIDAEKQVAKHSVVSENIHESTAQPDLLEDGSLSGAAFTELSVKAAATLGAAFGSVHSGKYLALGSDGKNSSMAILSAFSGGVISAGGNVWDLGRGFASEFFFMQTYSGMHGGAFVSTENGIVSIHLCGSHGLAPGRAVVRDCEYRFRRSDFMACNPEHCGSVREMSYLLPMYRRQLGLFKDEYYGARAFTIVSENEDIRDFCREFFGRHCVEEEGLPAFSISRDGREVTLTDELGEFASFDHLLALCCFDEFSHGNDVAVPYDAPKIIDRMASENGCHVLRCCDEDDAQNPEMAKRIAESVWSRDALFMTVKLLDMSIRRHTDLHGLLKQLPVFFVYEKSLAVPSDGAYTGEILRRFGEESETHTGAGIRLSRPQGEVLLTASPKGRRIRILAESEDSETAKELCGAIEDQIFSLTNH